MRYSTFFCQSNPYEDLGTIVFREDFILSKISILFYYSYYINYFNYDGSLLKLKSKSLIILILKYAMRYMSRPHFVAFNIFQNVFYWLQIKYL